MKDSNQINDFDFIYTSLIEHPEVFGYAEMGRNKLFKVIRISKKIILEIFSHVIFKDEKIFKNKYLFITLTNNQHEAIFDVYNNIKNKAQIISPLLFSKVTKTYKTIYSVRRLRYFLMDIFRDLMIGKNKFQNNFMDQFVHIFYNSGMKKSYILFFKKVKPKAIIFSNESNPHLRAVFMAAKELNIPTVFIQHASASIYYPKLEFDHIFLEGQYSRDVYRISETARVHMVGMPKFDKILRETKSKKISNEIKSVGIAVNLIDKNYKLLSKLIDKLKSIGYLVYFRPHPSLYPFHQKLNYDEISNPYTEPVQEFLNKVDVLVSGNSSIHLEAALLNVRSYHFNFTNGNHDDYYDFIKKGLCVKCNINNILQILNNYNHIEQPPKGKVKYYNASIGTDLEGYSSDYIAREILKL